MKKTEYAFLSLLVPDCLSNEVKEKSKDSMNDAANALQWHLYNGLSQNINNKIKLINALPIFSFPKYYRDMFVRRSVFKTDYSDENVNVGFCAFRPVKRFSIYKGVFKELKRWLKSSDSEKILFIYTLNEFFLKATKKLKKRYNFTVCAIVADLPEYSSLAKRNKITDMLMRILSDNSYRMLDCVDCYTLLTSQMSERLGVTVPYCVVEGISTESELPDNSEKAEKTVMYSGTLHEKFGILNLLNAFSMIKDKDYRLLICGTGDSVDKVKAAAQKDSRIKFMGQLVREEVLKLERTATVLINPRTNNGEYTKYSFPSKNIEYLSSGVPVICYKLDGIPDEYDDYFIYVPDDSLPALANKIEEICSLTDEERSIIGKKGYDFVQSQKNEIVQTKIITDMLNSIKK